ncbi:MAG TPA: prolyl oligopeptidase family serine peptidase [Longimicrobiales bacterium]|nr:prolyl oligopeptidase family serine peptidase [Longimicrobiales bacterium]
MPAPTRPVTLATRVSLFLLVVLAAPAAAQQKKALTFTDLMRMRQIENASLAADGRWIAFTAQPDRGDPEVVVHSTRGAQRYVVALGSNPAISRDGAWVAMRLNPAFEATETAKAGSAPHRGMALLATPTGAVTEFPEVQSFAFSGDGAWLAYHRYQAEPDSGAEAASGKRKPGTVLVVRNLASGAEREIQDVRSYVFDDDGDALAYAVAAADGGTDGLHVQRLAQGSETTVHAEARAAYSSVTWSKDGALAFLATREDEDGKPDPSTRLMSWKGSDTRVLASETDGWIIPVGAPVQWSESGSDVFFGWRPRHADEPAVAGTAPDEPEDGFDAYDTEAILSARGVDVWHWKDPVINSQQKIVWSREQNRTYRAVHHLADGSTVALAGLDLPDVDVPTNPRVALGRSDLPYRWESTWTGGATDVYLVDVATGARAKVAERLGGGRPDLSPEGRFVAYWDSGDYHLYDATARTTRNITQGLGVDFADEDHDTPDEPGGYGVGGWTDGDAAVVVYDKFDIWVIPTDGGRAWNLTEGKGRQERRKFRVIDTDPETEALGARDQLLLSSYDDVRKNFGFYGARMDRPGVTRLLEEDRRFQFRAKAADADVLMFTREDYDEFPDLWVAKPDLSDAHKVTDVNPNISDFAWGTSELTEWRGMDGTMLQGVVIKPGDYEPGKRYPVLVYYYELFSQRLHEFNEPAVNHRPSFPLYASNGYVVFLPDVRFEIGRPGYSATKAIVPGVQHLIDIGLADPDALALHGHSWSGYQTAQVVTQTDIFKTAVTGAPVANMTSAYSGIRWGSGLARQFQYEQGQSRLSGSLWEARDEYIDNSPVFFADRIHTPMLILHGDKDDAVPWYQSIELYLAMRRLGKEAVFLQYRDEPHHPQKYANKLDWAMKMKEWLDHYLKGAPPAPWITEGLPYSGR